MQYPYRFEPELTHWLANRTQSSGRAVGGKLMLTQYSLTFTPHGFDAALGGDSVRIGFEYIWLVDKAPVDFSHFFGGGLRKRLRVTLTDGRVELFVVNGLDQVIHMINTAVGAFRAGMVPPQG